MSVATTDGSEFWIAGGEEPTATYGISYYNDAILAPTNAVPGSNFYGKIQVFGGKFYAINILGAGGVATMHRLDTLPRTPTPLLAPMFASTSSGWRDFDIFSHTRIVVGGVDGLEFWNFNAALNAWQVTVVSDKTNIVGVGLSVDRSTVYVSTASLDGTPSAVFSYNVAAGGYNNNGTAILVAPAGVQFRCVAGERAFRLRVRITRCGRMFTRHSRAPPSQLRALPPTLAPAAALLRRPSPRPPLPRSRRRRAPRRPTRRPSR